MKEKTRIENPLEHHLQAFLSDTLQLGEILEKVLSFVGPARIIVSTYSTGEEFLRKMFRLKNKGLVTRSVLIADIKAAEKTARLNVLVRSVFDEVRLSENHSKVMVIHSETADIAVLTSQNQTRGNRLENYVIINSSSLVEELEKQFNDLRTASLWHS